MKASAKYDNYQCAPKDWRQIQDMTGSFELDAVIARCKNPEVAAKLEDHLVSDVPYKQRTAYNGLSGIEN